MIKKITLFIAAFITIEVAISQNIGVIPTPQEIEIKQDSFLWNSKNIIFYTQEINNEVTSLCNTFIEDINNIVYKTNKEESYLNKTISTNRKKINKGKTHIIELVINKDLSFKENSEQGYCIEIKPQYIKLEAPSYKGLFYATQTLKQLFKTNKKKCWDNHLLGCYACLTNNTLPFDTFISRYVLQTTLK